MFGLSSLTCLVADSSMCRRAIIAYAPGNVRPANRSHSVSPLTPIQNR